MAFHTANLKALNREANTTLTVLILIISALLGYAVKLIEAGSRNLAWSITLLLLVWFIVIAVVLVTRCLWAEDWEAPANEPDNLWPQEAFNYDDVRWMELKDLQRRIEFNRARCRRSGRALNQLRLAICLAPVWAGLVLAICTR